MLSFDATGPRVGIRRPTVDDSEEYLSLAHASESFHRPWVELPATPEKFESYIRSRQTPTDDGFFICERETGKLIGVINLNCIVRGSFYSAYLGYYVFAPFARHGYMTEAMNIVTRFAFTKMYLHRVEANIQPQNLASIALVRKCGFRKEGFSPRYLKIFNEWRDHERWALLADVQ